MSLSHNGRRLAEAYSRQDEEMPVGPVYLVIETTSSCNLECVMCPQPRMARARRHMPMALFERIVAQAAGSVEFAWLHLFGEPLANPRFGEMARRAAARGLRIGTSTNVTLLRGERVAEVASLPLDVLLLSMDGITAESYERVRVRADFDAVVENVRAFGAAWSARAPGERPASVVVSFIDLPILARETPEAAAFWRGMVPAEFILNRKPFHDWGRQDGLVDEILERVGAAPGRRRRGRGCHEFFRGLTVLSDGRCVPCCNDYEGRLVVGDLRAQTLAEVWNGPVLRRLRGDDVLDNDLCRYCQQYSPTRENALLEVSPFAPRSELRGYENRGSLQNNFSQAADRDSFTSR